MLELWQTNVGSKLPADSRKSDDRTPDYRLPGLRGSGSTATFLRRAP
jgi:hypothetical protein